MSLQIPQLPVAVHQLVEVGTRNPRKGAAQKHKREFRCQQRVEVGGKGAVVGVDPVEVFFIRDAAILDGKRLAHGRAGIFRNEGIHRTLPVEPKRVLLSEQMAVVSPLQRRMAVRRKSQPPLHRYFLL